MFRRSITYKDFGIIYKEIENYTWKDIQIKLINRSSIRIEENSEQSIKIRRKTLKYEYFYNDYSTSESPSKFLGEYIGCHKKQGRKPSYKIEIKIKLEIKVETEL